VSAFSRGAPQPSVAGSQSAFSFGTAVTEASTLVQSIATEPTTPATTERPTVRPPTTTQPGGRFSFRGAQKPDVSSRLTAAPVSIPVVADGDSGSEEATFRATDARRGGSSSSSSFSQSRATSGRALKGGSVFQSTAGSGVRSSSVRQTAGSSSSSSSSSFQATPSGVGRFFPGFAHQDGSVTRSSLQHGFDSRVPSFREDVIISSPTFSSDDIKPGFSCEGRPYGYYADEANDCKIFHICQPVAVSAFSNFYTRYSFFCGSETVFDQSKLSCTHAKDSIACGSSTDWHFRNDDFGRQAPREPEERLTEEEVFQDAA